MNFLSGLKEHGITRGTYIAPIAAAANKWGLSEMMIYNQALIESALDPNAHSPAGAVGLMQILPTTASLIPGLWSLKMPIAPLEDPEINLNLGAALMRWLFNEARKYKPDKKWAYMTALACYLSGTSAAHVKEVSEKGFNTVQMGYIKNIIKPDINEADWNELYIEGISKPPAPSTGKFPLLPLAAGLLLWWGRRK